jgi:uncharacterized protein (TIGR02594 family)
MAYEEQVLRELGFHSSCPNSEAFAQAVADWQARHRPLESDGKLGPNTWRRMRSVLGISGSAPGGTAGSEPLRPAGVGPLWLQVAQAEKNRWDTAIAGMSASQQSIAEFHMSRDEQYFMASPYYGGRVKAPGVIPANNRRLDWCAAFANWCLHRAGYSHTGNAGANSFIVRRMWRFSALTEPRQGCVTVVGNGARGAHVAFLWDWSNLPSSPNGHVVISGSRRISILGGNQSQRITIKSERRRMMAARGHNGVTSPYLWPEHGEANCNHVPATQHGHYCGNIHS